MASRDAETARQSATRSHTVRVVHLLFGVESVQGTLFVVTLLTGNVGLLRDMMMATFACFLVIGILSIPGGFC